MCDYWGGPCVPRKCLLKSHGAGKSNRPYCTIPVVGQAKPLKTLQIRWLGDEWSWSWDYHPCSQEWRLICPQLYVNWVRCLTFIGSVWAVRRCMHTKSLPDSANVWGLSNITDNPALRNGVAVSGLQLWFNYLENTHCHYLINAVCRKEKAKGSDSDQPFNAWVQEVTSGRYYGWAAPQIFSLKTNEIYI